MKPRNIIFSCLLLVLVVLLFGSFSSKNNRHVTSKTVRYQLGEIASFVKNAKPANEAVSEVNKSTPETTATSSISEDDRLHAILAAGDVCALSSNVFNLNRSISELARAPDTIRVNGDDDKMLENLFGTAGALNKNSSEEPKTNGDFISEFYNALLFSDLILGLQSRYVDLPNAESILLKLSIADESNGAYPYMLAAVLDKRHAPDAEIKKMLLLAFSKPRFDTFINTIARRIAEKSYQNPAYRMLSIAAISRLPIPNITYSFDLMKKFTATKDPELSRAAIRFSTVLTNQWIPPGGNFEMTVWNGLNYAIGEYIYKRNRKNFAADEVLPPAPRPFRSLMNQRDEKIAEKSAAVIAVNGQPGSNSKCDPQLMERVLPREKEEFIKAVLKLNN